MGSSLGDDDSLVFEEKDDQKIVPKSVNTKELPVKDDPLLHIKPISGTVRPINLDGGDDPLTQLILKVNEIIDYINGLP